MAWPLLGMLLGAAAGPLAPVLQPFVDQHAVAGVVALVSDKDKVLDVETVGWADLASRRPMTPDTLFWVASQSKPLAAVAVLLLVDEGRLSLDEPVTRWLPEFADLWISEPRQRPTTPLTLRHLLSHTSGLPYKSPAEEPSLDRLALEARLPGYVAQGLLFEPGSRYSYANAGINSAALVVQRVSGVPYEQFLHDRIFVPLGMSDTTGRPSAAQVARLATVYKPHPGGLEPTRFWQLSYPLDDPTRWPQPGSGLFSTAHDLAAFYRMLLNDGVVDGRPFLSPRALKLMLSKQTGELPDAYGLGIGLGVQVGHGGTGNTFSCFDREHNLITVLLVQQTEWAGDGKNLQPAFQRAALAAFGTPPPDQRHVVVFGEPGRYGGWPANHGLWGWGHELVVGFTAAWFKHAVNDHAIDRDKPLEHWQARSLDGGLTWTTERPPVFALPANRPLTLTEPLDFRAPDFALMFRYLNQNVGPSVFYVTTNRARTWRGPYRFAVEGLERIATRTDLVVLGPHDALMLGSAAKADGKEGRLFCARTTDGGLTWTLAGLIGDEPPGYAIMPSTVRLPSGALLTATRRYDPGQAGYIELWRSDDLGVHWRSLGQAAPRLGGGNPPSLVRLKDGRLALTYGYRARPWGVRARLSADDGASWGAEMVLHDDGLTGDLGYPRSLVRPDGRVVTVYYFNGPRDEDRTVSATIWTAK